MSEGFLFVGLDFTLGGAKGSFVLFWSHMVSFERIGHLPCISQANQPMVHKRLEMHMLLLIRLAWRCAALGSLWKLASFLPYILAGWQATVTSGAERTWSGIA